MDDDVEGMTFLKSRGRSRRARDRGIEIDRASVGSVPQSVRQLGVLLDQHHLLLAVAEQPVDGGLLEHPHERLGRLGHRRDVGRGLLPAVLVHIHGEAAPLALLGDAVIEVVQLLKRAKIAGQCRFGHVCSEAITVFWWCE
jgi:hypothetical protein